MDISHDGKQREWDSECGPWNYETARAEAPMSADATSSLRSESRRVLATLIRLLGDFDLLRFFFSCCHPALSPFAQFGLTQHKKCGLSSDVTARSFLLRAPTVAQ